MAREEIIAGLRNAVERGQSIQQAMQSMINAGYQVNEVQEASRFIDLGATGTMQQTPSAYVSQEQYSTGQEQATALPIEAKKSSPNTKIIILTLVLVLLLAGLGAMIYFMLK
jgi:hypothetical protein